MKRTTILIAMAGLLLSACSGHYLAVDHVDRHLGGSRTLYSTDSTTLGANLLPTWNCVALEHPLPIDFRPGIDSMRYAYTLPITPKAWNPTASGLSRLLTPEVEVERSFRWFTTHYTYRARFAQADSLPLPLDRYMTPDEQQLYLDCNEWPTDWNGAELYALLDRLNEKAIRWAADNIFELQYRLYYSHADSSQQATLARYHNEMLTRWSNEEPSLDLRIEQVAAKYTELSFIPTLTPLISDAEQQQTSAIIERILTADNVLWRIEMPGGHTEQHMLSSLRTFTRDYGVEVGSSIPNWWVIGFSILLLLIAIAVLLWRHHSIIRQP